ncbi:MAG: UDP-N-acetylmuramoyl-L-alanine--D-glutamate ligase [Clostridia bacterium]|nr:UDP-N-acetylmuramoyl-L-alanine--D-glutamate ligase [Clostridia bacterium]
MTLTDIFQNKTVSLLGAGISNMPLAAFLKEQGASLTVRDMKSAEELGERAAELEKLGARLITGEHYMENFSEDYIFRSPGIRPDLPALCKAAENGCTLTSEMEMFLSHCPCSVFAVTGSDGKSTTTTITHLLLTAGASEGTKTFLGGNIGEPLFHRLPLMCEKDLVAVELSSFQLMTIDAPVTAAAITNVTPNHLNWHTDMAEYIEAKKRILRKAGKAVLNYGNDVTRAIGEELIRENSIPVTFFSREPIACDILRPTDSLIYAENGSIVTEFAGEGKKTLLALQEIKLPGMHNAENYMTAIALTHGYCTEDRIRQVAREFGGVRHRLEHVASIGGVSYINSSIDSSPTRTAAALSALAGRSIVLICGGYDKKIPFAPLAETVLTNPGVHTLVLTGATACSIREAVENHPLYEKRCGEGFVLVTEEVFDEAVFAAAGAAHEGDTVLLSPACASFDAFPNFEVRGEHYKTLVHSDRMTAMAK